MISRNSILSLDSHQLDGWYRPLDGIGEIITEKGIGNGISLIIFAGIVARSRRESATSISAGGGRNHRFLNVFSFVAIALLVIAGVEQSTKDKKNSGTVYKQ